MKVSLFVLSAVATSATAFAPTSKPAIFGVRAGGSSSSSLDMINIAEGVDFDTIAREWRCKWSPEAEKSSLVTAQKALEAVLEDLKKVPGVKRVDRVVCGGCLDFKVSTVAWSYLVV